MIKKIVFMILFLIVLYFQAEAFGQAFRDSIRHSNGHLFTTGMFKIELIQKFGYPIHIEEYYGGGYRRNLRDKATAEELISAMVADMKTGQTEEWFYVDGKTVINVVIRGGRVVNLKYEERKY